MGMDHILWNQIKGLPHPFIQATCWFLVIQSLTVCHLFVEPVGTTRPKFDSRLESSTIAERQGAAMALTCLAQSNPAPVFRFVLRHV